jgi:hypothetical protein
MLRTGFAIIVVGTPVIPFPIIASDTEDWSLYKHILVTHIREVRRNKPGIDKWCPCEVLPVDPELPVAYSYLR